MIGRWQADNNAIFVRDLLRDFCTVHTVLTEQNTRFSQSGTISYAVLRELLGEALRKGVFWRLKDTAHHLFRKKNQGRRDFECDTSKSTPPQSQQDSSCQHAQHFHSSESMLESILDWCIGYAFHECTKLKEDAFQRQHYSNRLLQIQQRAQEHTELIEELMPFTSQTRESIDREMARILGVLDYARKALVLYLRNHGNNGPVARFLAEHEELLQKIFQEHWKELLFSLYGNNISSMYLLAATACFEGGHRTEAAIFVEKAQAHGADVTSLEQLTTNPFTAQNAI